MWYLLGSMISFIEDQLYYHTRHHMVSEAEAEQILKHKQDARERSLIKATKKILEGRDSVSNK